jgi:hypothetical protein
MSTGPELSKRHKKTLQRIFEHPVPPNLPWRDIEALFVALGAEIEEGSGSRVAIVLSGNAATFHRPHPRPDTNKGAVAAVRDFLELAGVRP